MVHPQREWMYGQRHRLWTLIGATQNLTWLLLTKRPQNVMGMVPPEWIWGPASGNQWPRNVWIGTTVEDQKRADERLAILASIPAPVRFVSMEPQLEWVSLGPWLPKLQWVIQGGESDPFGRRSHARPFDMAWADTLHAQCKDTGVPYFFKQAGHNPYDSREPDSDDGFVAEDPSTDPACWVELTGKGDDPSEWPPHLRAQEVPVTPW
jgi:protein gp37